VTAVTRELIYKGRKIQLARDTIPGPDGGLIDRDVILHPGAAAILALLDQDHVCLLENERPIVGETLLEIPAGTLDPGESPELAARRELAEETGYRARSWKKLAEFFPSPGVLSERTHLYLARDLTPGARQLERDENLEPKIVAWNDAVRGALDGTIHDAKTLVAILLWDRFRFQPDFR
jgi:ADP-ribose pyrophosphatase